jgi:hypothetical protein
MAVNLKDSARQWVLNHLPYDRADADLGAHLSGLNARGLLIVYYNWMSRLVKPHPRRVQESKAFKQNPIVIAHASDFAQIIGDIESGNDLRRYLSRGVEIATGMSETCWRQSGRMMGSSMNSPLCEVRQEFDSRLGHRAIEEILSLLVLDERLWSSTHPF